MMFFVAGLAIGLFCAVSEIGVSSLSNKISRIDFNYNCLQLVQSLEKRNSPANNSSEAKDPTDYYVYYQGTLATTKLCLL